MNRNSFFIAAMAIGVLTVPLSSRSAEPEIVVLGPTTFWRCHYTLKPPVLRKGGLLKTISIPAELKVQATQSQPGKWLDFETPPPPENWRTPEFNDVEWHRGFVFDPESPWIAYLALRGKFSVSDPDQAKDIKLVLRSCGRGCRRPRPAFSSRMH